MLPLRLTIEGIYSYQERQTIEFSALTQAGLFGIFGIVEKQEALLDDDIQALIDERLEARKAKNFARSDEIRDLLKEQGIVLEDTPQGTRWRREA